MPQIRRIPRERRHRPLFTDGDARRTVRKRAFRKGTARTAAGEVPAPSLLRIPVLGGGFSRVLFEETPQIRLVRKTELVGYILHGQIG